MALRLADQVYCGEIFNTRKNSVHGWLGLRGIERPISLQLTGNCDPDLAGKRLRFEVRGVAASLPTPTESETAWLKRNHLCGLAWQQVGPTGTMTAARRVRVFECSTREFYVRCKLGEPPPTEWKRGLYLEWFSQNGRVVLELADPIIRFLDPKATDEESDRSVETPDEPGWTEPASSEYEADRIREGDETIRELELMDELIESGPGEPLGMLFDEPLRLPRPDGLDEVQAEQSLKVLLGQLALHGVAIDMCEHFTPLETYRWLVNDICQEETAYPALKGTQWVQHYSTFDCCPKCNSE